MNVYIIVLSAFCIAGEALKHDYWHAATWACVALGAYINIVSENIIRDLKKENTALRASRDAWAANARANTILKNRERP